MADAVSTAATKKKAKRKLGTPASSYKSPAGAGNLGPEGCEVAGIGTKTVLNLVLLVHLLLVKCSTAYQ